MYVGPHALQRSFKEMELSMFYRTEVLQRPDGVRDWVCDIFYLKFSSDPSNDLSHSLE